MQDHDALDRAVKSAVCELVTVARIFDSMEREEDSKIALELARDVSGLLSNFP